MKRRSPGSKLDPPIALWARPAAVAVVVVRLIALTVLLHSWARLSRYSSRVTHEPEVGLVKPSGTGILRYLLVIAASSAAVLALAAGCQSDCTAIGLPSKLDILTPNPERVQGASSVEACIGSTCATAPYTGSTQSTVRFSTPPAELAAAGLRENATVSVTFVAGDGKKIESRTFENVGSIVSSGGDCGQNIWSGTVTI